MSKYILRRVLISIPVFFGITVLSFIFINLAPGDPIDAMVNPQAQLSPEDLQHMRVKLGLNKPAPVRYLLWLQELLHGNLGYSYASNEPVTERILRNILPTLEVMGLSLLIAIVVGITLGVLSALKQYSILDHSLTLLSFVGISVPSFFLGLLFIYVLSLKLNVLPPYGMRTVGQPLSLADHLRHLILPAITLSFFRLPIMVRYTRSSMLEVIRQEYVTSARAKGLKEIWVLMRHAFPNAVLPLITIIGLSLGTLLGGAIVIESVFQWPGMGLLGINAIMRRDYPVLMGVSMVTAVMVLLANLLTDIAYSVVDPRIRYQ